MKVSDENTAPHETCNVTVHPDNVLSYSWQPSNRSFPVRASARSAPIVQRRVEELLQRVVAAKPIFIV